MELYTVDKYSASAHPINMGERGKKSESLSEALGRAIREIRYKMPISQEELAHRADLDRSYMGAVERGVYNLTVKNIAKIAQALGEKPSKLFKLAESYWSPSQKENKD